MPAIGSLKQIEEQERRVDPARRYADLAVQFRVLNADSTPGRLLTDDQGQPIIVGGRWDTMAGAWLDPQPADLDVLTWTIQEQQLRMLYEVPLVVIYVALFAGRQAGKTFAAVMFVALDAIRWPNRDSAIVSLDFKASRDPEKAFRTLIRPWLKSKIVKHIKSDRVYLFPHGHRVVFRSRENIDSMRGPSLKTILLDEASRYKYEDFNTAEGCGAASKAFRIILATTPKRGVQWIREVGESWEHGQLRRRLFRLRTDDNPRRNQAMLEELKANTPADLYKQEFEGKLVAPAGAAYGGLFRRGLHVRPPGILPEGVRFQLEGPPKDWTSNYCQKEFDVDADFVGGWDFMKEATIVAKIYRDTRIVKDPQGHRKQIARLRIWVLAAEINLDTTTDHHARFVRNKWGRRIAIVTDAMGQHPDAGGRRKADRSAHDILREHGFAHVEPVARSNPDVEARHDAMSRAIRSAFEWPGWEYEDEEGGVLEGGEVCLFIAPKGCRVEVQRPNGSIATVTTDGCPGLVDALENQTMTNGKPDKDGVYDHINDALGYLVYSVMPISGGPAPGWSYPYRKSDDGDA